MSQHPIVHIEIATHDREKAAAFYHSLFGWQVDQMPEMNYATFDSGSVGGGFNPISDENPAGTIAIYVNSEDIEADLVRAQALGAKILTHKTEIPTVGWWGTFEDPDGNKVNLYTSLNPAGASD